jgi:hypothetical protein
MRKTLAIAFLALIGVGLLAGPALAQRDPFDPAIDVNESPPPVGEGEPEPEPEPAEPEPEEQPPDDLAETGFAAQPFVVLAYALVVTGVAALAIGGVGRREH